MNLAFQTELRKLKDFHESTCSLYIKKMFHTNLQENFLRFHVLPSLFNL